MASDYKELIADLQEHRFHTWSVGMEKAADAITALVAERDRLREELAAARKQLQLNMRNLNQGMSKSMQRLQARMNEEVLATMKENRDE